jgi:protein-tyrosine-phosphatase
MQEIQIVCKRNEVRSPFLASFLKLHLPDVKLSSSGVLAKKTHTYDLVAKNIAEKWGFEYKEAKVNKTKANVYDRLYLPLDSFVQSELEKLLKTEQILRLNLAGNQSEMLIPLDPYQHTENKMKYELAKLLGFAVQQLRQVKSFQFPQNIEAIIPRNSLSTSGIYFELAEMRNKNQIIVVDASLKVPNQKFIQAPEGVLQPPLGSPIPGAIYSTIFEFPESEKLLCSLRWRDWLTQLTEVAKVFIVTPPLEDENGSQIYDSHLSAIWAEVKNIV